jgi:hypothetical protein
MSEREGRRPPRRLIRRGETYTADDEVELEGPDPDVNPPPEAEQLGDLEHEGGPPDGGN